MAFTLYASLVRDGDSPCRSGPGPSPRPSRIWVRVFTQKSDPVRESQAGSEPESESDFYFAVEIAIDITISVSIGFPLEIL